MSSRSCVTAEPVTAALSAAASERELTPSRRASSWSTFTRTCRAGSIQSKWTCRVRASAARICANSSAMPADLVLVGPHDPVLQRPADRRPQFERRDARHDLGKLLGQHLLQLLLQALARRSRSLATITNCAKNGFASWTSKRQDEADRAAPDVGAVVVDVGIVLQDRLEPLRLRLGRVDRRVLRAASC